MTSEQVPSKSISESISKSISLDNPDYFISRELSWLEFNDRVLNEALDERTPLLERLKFMGIFSSNLDEYFMVRVAGLKQQILANISKRTPDGRTPQDQLRDISERLRPMVELQHIHFEVVLRPQLANHGIYLTDYDDLNAGQQAYLQEYFEEQIFPVLTPLAVDPGHPFPYISNLSLNLAVVIRDRDTGEEHFARVKVPKVLPRFIVLSDTYRTQQRNQTTYWAGVPIEQVIANNLNFLFPGMAVQAYYAFRITRNADLEVEEDEADDLMLAIEQELRKRRLGGSVVRLEIQASTPDTVRDTLIRELELSPRDIYNIEGLIGLGDVMTLMSIPLPELKDPNWRPVVPKWLQHLHKTTGETALEAEEGEDFFAVLRRGDRLVHHPYHSFSSTVQRFITQAAQDADVLAIKMTLYRTSGDSPIINALISAAENGKQVAVLVELKARFDEENNINWARKLERSGVHVVYGLMGLKTHTKVTLVVRREQISKESSQSSRIRRYVHIGTGNYNPKTASLYTDMGILSCSDDLGADLTDLFNYLTGHSRQQTFRQLMVAPINLRQQMMQLIRGEIAQCEAGQSGKIIAKMNSLVDPEMIKTLYNASQAGVEIDLIIRGICCLRPGIPGVSERIRVISVVGRLLEHSRLFYFHNGGDEVILLGSADWMPRNLDRRVEAVVPITNPGSVAELKTILALTLADNRQAWELQPDGQYRQRCPEHADQIHSSQQVLMERAQEAASWH